MRGTVDNRVVGIDVGGTFTDFVLLRDGQMEAYKLPSTPADPSRGILQGIKELKADGASFVHGSTVATNALLERKGARTALVTTHGFEDILEIGRQYRPELYNLEVERPPVLVPRELRLGLKERVDHTGTPLDIPSKANIDELVNVIRELGADAVAVSLLFSFLNPAHEAMVKEAIERSANDVFLSVSSEVLPEFREYERTSTVVVNAYVGPLMSSYLGTLNKALGSGLRVMQSSGGSITALAASKQPVCTILSGPAGGVVGAFHVASMAGHSDVITLDMGGTSTDVSLCPGRIKETGSSNVGGYPIGVPMIDIHTVGAGGGSIARLDQGGSLRVGPDSAGADPGPACYGKGDFVTVTDANLILGRLQPQYFLGGKLPLDRDCTERLVGELAGEIDTTSEKAALGIVRVINAGMERAVRAISLERGYDPREFTLLAFGGAGPMHACELSQEMGIPRVLVPPNPGVLSAMGVAIADIVKDYSRTVMLRRVSRDRLDEEFWTMEAQARNDLEGEGIDLEQATAKRFLDVRYVGQSYELTVDYPKGKEEPLRAIASSFHRTHKQRFGYSDPSEPIELVNLRLKMVVPAKKLVAELQASAGENSQAARSGEANVVFQEGTFETPLYLRERLQCGCRVAGPALVVQTDSTTLIPPGWVASVDQWKNLLITPDG